MKILYIGTVTENNEYEKILKESRIKASSAPHVFETAFAKGLAENGVTAEEIEFLSFPMIASFPGSKLLRWGAKKQKIIDTYDTTWIPAINVQGLKMRSQARSSKKLIKAWFKKHADEPQKCILMYSLYQPIAKNVIKLCQKHGCKCFAFVPDLPKHMYLNKTGIKALLARRYLKKATAIQGKMDGYIYLTEAMKEEISPEKPYVVVEGIADTSTIEIAGEECKSNVILYAGAISKRYGFPNLIRAFSMMDNDLELHIYGYGDYADELAEHAKQDPRIRYMGRCPRAEILKKEKEAALLINVRNAGDEFTKYSFPSKTMEYMLSGTPLLTTRLPGIPEEYFKHCIAIDSNEPEAIKEAIEAFFNRPNEERIAMGENAKAFIMTDKNQKTQAEKVLLFLQNTFSQA